MVLVSESVALSVLMAREMLYRFCERPPVPANNIEVYE